MTLLDKESVKRAEKSLKQFDPKMSVVVARPTEHALF
mgnify:CR=1 FL=1